MTCIQEECLSKKTKQNKPYSGSEHMQSVESCKIFRELFAHSEHTLSQRKRKWILSKKDTDHCFHNADTIDDVNAWLRGCCCWRWSWRCVGKHGRGSIVLFNVLGSSWPRNLVASQLFNHPLCMISAFWLAERSTILTVFVLFPISVLFD